MNVSRHVFVAAAGLLIFVGCFAASFAQPPREATSDKAKKPPAGGQANPVDGPVQLPSRAAENTEALLRAINAGSLQEISSRFNVSQIDEGLALDERAAEALQVLQNPSSATQRGIGYVVFHQAGTVSQPAGTQRKWGPEQATGAPDSPDYPDNQGTAWCPATEDGQEEWLELTYGEPVEPLVLVVYECLKPGALTRVTAYDAEGNELNAWSGKDPSPPDSGNRSAISVVPLKLKKIKIVRLRLYFDSPHVEGWNEIDAAGILDVKGVVHWATAATASSTWVDQTAAALSEDMWLDSRVNLSQLRGSSIDLSRAVFSALDTDLNVVGWQLLTAAQQRDNETRGGNSDRVTLFEERIKKLESDLAGLREALQQLKAPPGDKSNTP